MRLPWITGPKQAKEMLLTGQDRLPAARALDLGIVNRVVPAADLEQAALSLAQEITAAAPAAVRMTKQAINRSYEIMGLRQRSEERRVGKECVRTCSSRRLPDH